MIKRIDEMIEKYNSRINITRKLLAKKEIPYDIYNERIDAYFDFYDDLEELKKLCEDKEKK